MSNVYELAAREKKASVLATAVLDYGYASLVHHMDQAHWIAVARKIGVLPPSAETIAMVREIVARHGSVSE